MNEGNVALKLGAWLFLPCIQMILYYRFAVFRLTDWFRNGFFMFGLWFIMYLLLSIFDKFIFNKGVL